VIKKFPRNKSPEPDGVNAESYQSFSKLTPIFLKLFQETEKEGTLPNSFYESSFTFIPKTDKDTTQK
jgi:hypothetical protein